MQIEVHIRNGRTAFRFAKRAHFTQVLTSGPDHQSKRVVAEVKHHPDNPDWKPVSIRSINPNSVSFVLEVPKDEAVSGYEEGES